MLAHIAIDGPRLESSSSIASRSHFRPSGPHRQACSADIASFTERLLFSDLAACLLHVEALRSEGWSRVDILLRILAPTAQRLGALWQEDLCDFMDVSVGVGRLQAIVNILDADDAMDRPAACPASALFLAAPGETHTFGVSIIDRVFRSGGWLTRSASPSTVERTVAETSFDVVGFSLGHARCADGLAQAIERVRRGSRNPDVLVMVGGKAVLDDPGLLATIGGDATAPDAEATFDLACCLLNRHIFV